MTELAAKHCVPCNAETPKLSASEVERALTRLPGWSSDGTALAKRFEFPDFASALAFTNRIGEEAEREGHHPDLKLGWGYVEIELSTHAIGGLSENDLILAAKIERALS